MLIGLSLTDYVSLIEDWKIDLFKIKYIITVVCAKTRADLLKHISKQFSAGGLSERAARFGENCIVAGRVYSPWGHNEEVPKRGDALFYDTKTGKFLTKDFKSTNLAPQDADKWIKAINDLLVSLGFAPHAAPSHHSV